MLRPGRKVRDMVLEFLALVTDQPVEYWQDRGILPGHSTLHHAGHVESALKRMAVGEEFSPHVLFGIESDEGPVRRQKWVGMLIHKRGCIRRLLGVPRTRSGTSEVRQDRPA